MFAEMRTGSNFLEANLNALSGVTCHGEVFNPFFIGRKDQMELLGITLAEREQDPWALLRRLRDRTAGLSGFRYFHDHDPRVFDAVMEDRRCAKIILTRNPVDSYVSWKIAQATGQWKLTNPKNLKVAQARFDGAEFTRHLDALQEFQIRLMNRLQTSGQTAFYVDYDDIQSVEVLNGLADWLGVPARLESLDDTLKKQNPEEISSKVANFDEMERALSRLDRFNLSRTPNFEPRRPAGIPGFVASRAAPLLFMPVKGGPVARVTAWLDALGGVEGEFVQKTLRQWKRGHPGHRSFTVLRHPLARAHAVFCTQILGAPQQEFRNMLSRQHGLNLPKAGQHYPDAGAHRDGFLAFLRFAKKNLGGQTSVKVDPHWASQSAIVQGFAQFQSPDALLREDRLSAGLTWLCAEVGVSAPPLPPAQEEAPVSLARIWDEELEVACRDAYGRDYQGFGFGDWSSD
jgi:hypothetical protein